MSVYRGGEREEETREETRTRETMKEIRKFVKLTYSAEHRKFNTFIDVGFSTF